MFWLIAARLYARLHWFCIHYLRCAPPGLGWLCRRIRLEHVIEVQGRRYFFSRRGAGMYAYLIAGWFPEPETHRFFERVFASEPAEPVTFIDVGAAVGEMLMDVARYPNVQQVVGYEPDPDLVEACRLSACVNRFDKVVLRAKPLSDVAGPVRFALQHGRGSSGSIVPHGGDAAADSTRAGDEDDGDTLVAGTLDTEFPTPIGSAILLIDVEGAEVRVLRGGREFIRANRPLIIFEFNYVSRRSFSLDDVRAELGEAYSIYRLRKDGLLDTDFSDTWNCVAIHHDSVFARHVPQWLAVTL